MTDTLEVALNKLTAWKGNVRKTGAKDGISELAASIATHGLLQSLVVRKTRPANTRSWPAAGVCWRCNRWPNPARLPRTTLCRARSPVLTSTQWS